MKLPKLNNNRLPTLQPKHKTLAKPKTWGKEQGSRPWRRLKDQVLKRDNYTCQHCGIVSNQLECDHIVNIAQGGTDDISNLQSLCIACHRAKTQSESAIGQYLAILR